MSRMMAVVGVLALAIGAIASYGTSSAASAGQVPGVTCGKPNDAGLIVFLDFKDVSGTPDVDGYESAIIVYTPDGTEVQRLPLAAMPDFRPLSTGCSVLLYGPEIGSIIFDAASGKAIPIVLPDDFGDSLSPANGWLRTFQERRWAFLSDGGVTHTLLVNLQTGESTDLGSLVRRLRNDDEGVVVVLGARLSPDESSFLLLTDRDTWLVPTADPSQARLLMDAEVARASLADDGASILYVAESATGTSHVVTERLDGSGRRILAEVEDHSNAYWVPGTDSQQVLVVQSITERVSLLNASDGRDSRVVGELPGTLTAPPIFSPSGQRALLRTNNDGAEWTLVDLDSGTARVLAALKGRSYPYTRPAPGLRWLTFLPSDTPIVQPGSSVLRLDLEDGTISTLLTFDFEEPYAGIGPTNTLGSSPDGRYVVIDDFGTDYPRFWLLDAQQGTSAVYDGRIASAFSHDGRQLIVSEPVAGNVWRTVVMTVDGRDVRVLAESVGRGGLWVPSPYS